MHIVEKLESQFRLKPQTPNIYFEYVSIPFDRFITICNESNIQSNNYDLMQDVVDDIYKILKDNNIRILQIFSSDKDIPLNGAIHLRELSHGQINYLIRDSLFHICTDPYTNEISGITKTSSISLIGNRFSDNFYPFFGNTNNLVLSGLKENSKPSFSSNENPKVINNIKPEIISRSVLFKLGFNKEIGNTINIGRKYLNQEVIDVIPNFYLNNSNFKDKMIYIRFDKFFDEKNASTFLQNNRCCLITDKCISEQFLSIFKQNITDIIYIVDSKLEHNFTNAQALGIKFNLISKDIKNRLSIINKFLDYGVNFIEDKYSNIKDGNVFKTKKIILSKGSAYPSYFHVEKDEKLATMNKFYNNKHLEEEVDFWRIIRK